MVKKNCKTKITQESQTVKSNNAQGCNGGNRKMSGNKKEKNGEIHEKYIKNQNFSFRFLTKPFFDKTIYLVISTKN